MVEYIDRIHKSVWSRLVTFLVTCAPIPNLIANRRKQRGLPTRAQDVNPPHYSVQKAFFKYDRIPLSAPFLSPCRRDLCFAPSLFHSSFYPRVPRVV